jgi:hypothetical protein
MPYPGLPTVSLERPRPTTVAVDHHRQPQSRPGRRRGRSGRHNDLRRMRRRASETPDTPARPPLRAHTASRDAREIDSKRRRPSGRRLRLGLELTMPPRITLGAVFYYCNNPNRRSGVVGSSDVFARRALTCAISPPSSTHRCALAAPLSRRGRSPRIAPSDARHGLTALTRLGEESAGRRASLSNNAFTLFTGGFGSAPP